MRSVVVVLPASMCAMIPMLRVSWSENLRVIDCEWVGFLASLGIGPAGKKIGPLGPTRATGLMWTGLRRYPLEVSIVVVELAGSRIPRVTRDADPTIAEEFGALDRHPACAGAISGRLGAPVNEPAQPWG